MSQAYQLSVAQAARQIAQGELSPVELVESLLRRIESLGPGLKAWVYLDQEAVLAEARIKAEEVKSGAALGPLHGVPIGLKDIYYTAGIPTTACSRLYADFVPEYDATTVTLMKNAGAIMLGKTVTTEFACLDPSPTLNPWNAKHTPGGSSSGSAVAVAVKMCPAAMGSQTIGSVLRPASYNGVVGFKPTLGRVSRHGIIPVSWSLDTAGWITRTVEDAALLLDVMAGADPQDPVASTLEPEDYVKAATSPAAPRIGLLQGYFHENSDAETRSHMEQIAERLSRAGATVEEITLPGSIETAMDDQRLIMAVEGGAFHQEMFRTRSEEYQPLLREMLRWGLEASAVDYSRALERRLRFIADMKDAAAKADVLLTASTPTPALADLTNTGNSMYQGPWTSCGLPAISIPSGLATSGLPLGIQLASAHFQEARLLAAARWCESVLDVQLSPPEK
ncbi:MAG: amidase [Chloroflexi bacterium]|nr:amidase [Chloroflexota bacterium]